MTHKIDGLIFSVTSKIPNVSENKIICDKIELLKNERDITRLCDTLSDLILSIPQQVNVTYNVQESNVNLNNEIADPKKPFINKILNSTGYSLGAASALSALSYSICGICNLENQHYISIGVFAFIFFLSLPIVFVVIEK